MMDLIKNVIYGFLMLVCLGALFYAIKLSIAVDTTRETLNLSYALEDTNIKSSPNTELVPEINSPGVPNVDPEQLTCLSLNMWFEGRNKSSADRLATAHTVLNRVSDSRWPNTICGVIYQGRYKTDPETKASILIKHKCQFSWYCDGKSDTVRLTDHKGRVIKKNVAIWEDIQKSAFAVIAGETEDPTKGANHYYNPKAVNYTPRWATAESLVHVSDGHNYHNI